MSDGVERSVLWKGILVGLLAIISSGLFVVQRPGSSRQSVRPAIGHSIEGINAVIDTLFGRYGIRSTWVRTWRVQVPNREFKRIERRVYVPTDFISLTFNHDLNTMLSEFDAKAIATERSKENTVSMHIMQNGIVIQSLLFVVKRDLDTVNVNTE